MPLKLKPLADSQCTPHHFAEDVPDVSYGYPLPLDPLLHLLVPPLVPPEQLAQVGEDGLDRLPGQVVLLQHRPVEQAVHYLQRAKVAALSVKQLWNKKNRKG